MLHPNILGHGESLQQSPSQGTTEQVVLTASVELATPGALPTVVHQFDS